MGEYKEAMRQARSLASSISLSRLGSLEEVVAAIERSCNVKVRLRPLPSWMPPGITGLMIPKGKKRLVLFEDRDSAHLRDRAIAHELGHIIFGHSGACADGSSVLASLLPDLDPCMVQRVLMRHAFENAQEAEAEAFSDLIMERLASENSRRGDEPLGFGEVFG